MRKDYEKLFTQLKAVEPPAGLFERIITAIRREQELQQTRRLLIVFLSLFVISLAAVPFSWTIFIKQMEISGILYFISIAISDLGTFLALWQNFALAILESLPVIGIAVFTMNIALALFALRLFLYRKKLLLKYLMQNFNFKNDF